MSGSERPASVASSDIRRELMLTVREVALSLLKQSWNPEVLREISGDMEREAAYLRDIADRHKK
jgi:hypothetical protein